MGLDAGSCLTTHKHHQPEVDPDLCAQPKLLLSGKVAAFLWLLAYTSGIAAISVFVKEL